MSTLTLNNWISLHLWKEYTSCDFYKQYLLQGTVALGIPLLRVQTDNDSLTQEQGRPHDYVPDGAFPFVMQNEVEHHCERTKREDNEKLTYRFNLTGFTWPRHDTTIIWCSTTQVISFLLKGDKVSYFQSTWRGRRAQGRRNQSKLQECTHEPLQTL